MISLRTPDGDAEIGTVSVLTPDGDKLIGRISVLTPDGDKLIYDSATGGGGGLAVNIDPALVIGSALTDDPATVTTATATASVTGGTAPYTFAWALDSGNVGWTATNPTAATTSFRFATIGPGDSEFGVFEVTVTDARGRTATGTVEVQAYNYGAWRFI